MKEYRLKIIYMAGNSSYWNTSVSATDFNVKRGIYWFYDGTELVYTSPAQLTIIERISDNG